MNLLPYDNRYRATRNIDIAFGEKPYQSLPTYHHTASAHLQRISFMLILYHSEYSNSSAIRIIFILFYKKSTERHLTFGTRSSIVR